MTDRKLAVRYARALLSALPDPKSAVQADEFLTALAEAAARSGELRDVLYNPAVPGAGRKRVLLALAEGAGAPRFVRNFMGVLADHGRAAALPSIALAFRELREEAMGLVRATVTVAVPMTPETRERARAALETMTGKKVEIAVGTDPALLGGAVTRIGSTVFDGSLRTQLSSLRRRLAGE